MRCGGQRRCPPRPALSVLRAVFRGSAGVAHLYRASDSRCRDDRSYIHFISLDSGVHFISFDSGLNWCSQRDGVGAGRTEAARHAP